MQVKSIAECSNGSILQYFRPSLSYHLSLRSLFCLFLSGRLRQVLLYLINFRTNLKKSIKLPISSQTVEIFFQLFSAEESIKMQTKS